MINVSTLGLSVSKSTGSINLSFTINSEDEEFFVRIASEDGQKLCDGIFSQYELENIHCPFEKWVVAYSKTNDKPFHYYYLKQGNIKAGW